MNHEVSVTLYGVTFRATVTQDDAGDRMQPASAHEVEVDTEATWDDWIEYMAWQADQGSLHATTWPKEAPEDGGLLPSFLSATLSGLWKPEIQAKAVEAAQGEVAA